MSEEAPIGVNDIVVAEMVDCTPPEPAKEIVELPDELADSPIRQGFKAQIEQVGAEPPPDEVR